jgi:hypothetical protein
MPEAGLRGRNPVEQKITWPGFSRPPTSSLRNWGKRPTESPFNFEEHSSEALSRFPDRSIDLLQIDGAHFIGI